MYPNREKEINALFVDLTNFYTRFAKSGLLEPNELRRYFTDWFDFSALSLFLTGETSDIWVFHSDSKLGPPDARIDGRYLNKLIERFDLQTGVTTQNVNIIGQQREPYSVKCKKCGTDADAIWKSEKGIDSSLIVHLFDTMQYWDRAYLLSGDADFVPAVRSLRRQGKVVNGAGFVSQASSALVKECFRYEDLELFFREDISAYSVFDDQGLIHKLLTQNLVKDPIKDSKGEIFRGKVEITVKMEHYYSSDEVNLGIWLDIMDLEGLRERRHTILVPNEIERGSYSISFNQKMLSTIHIGMEKISKTLNLKRYKNIDYNGGSEFATCTGFFEWNDKKATYVRTNDDE